MLHIVLFKLDAVKLAREFPGELLQESVDIMVRTIPGVVEVHLDAKNDSPWEGYIDASQGYTHALVSRHVNCNALRIYAEHPTHKMLQSRLFKCLTAPPLRMELDMTSRL